MEGLGSAFLLPLWGSSSMNFMSHMLASVEFVGCPLFSCTK